MSGERPSHALARVMRDAIISGDRRRMERAAYAALRRGTVVACICAAESLLDTRPDLASDALAILGE